MNDQVRHAYARLGLPIDAPPAAIRRRFRTLVRIWHPDRFASNPKGQKEATQRMAQINQDYQLLSRRVDAGHRAADTPETPQLRSLDQAEVDSLIRSLGTEGPIDLLFGEIDYFYFFCRNPPRLLGARGRAVLAFLTATAALGALWAGWAVAKHYGGSDSLAWLMFGTAGLFAFIAAIEIRELLKARRSR